MPGETDLPGLALKASPPLSIANEQKFDVGKSPHQSRRGGQEIVVPFQPDQTRDLAHHEICWGNCKTATQGWIVAGGQEWLQGEPAENA
jgi:hypothetical protein